MTKEISLSQGKVALVDDEDYAWLSHHKWSAWKSPVAKDYWKAVRGVTIGRASRQIIMMHREIMKPPEHEEVDYINHNPLDNRRCNLRICGPDKQVLNRRPSTTGRKTSRFKGVCWDARKGRWMARFRAKFLGLFEDEVQAARVYDAAAHAFDPEFSWLNFPMEA